MKHKWIGESNPDDPRQLEIAAMRHNSGHDNDGLPFRQCIGQECRIHVGRSERFESHL
ncbi:MAG: hypothetical protein HGB32_00080 [Geobacteraceae bacterium]|nr:hypothetical protein [Geobacteraceae bacterium]NTW78530.1 hypothetical protein [Geobacteraceae bacterium]